MFDLRITLRMDSPMAAPAKIPVKSGKPAKDERNRWESAAQYERNREPTKVTLDPKIKNPSLRLAKKLGISLSKLIEERLQSELVKRGLIPFRKVAK